MKSVLLLCVFFVVSRTNIESSGQPMSLHSTDKNIKTTGTASPNNQPVMHTSENDARNRETKPSTQQFDMLSSDNELKTTGIEPVNQQPDMPSTGNNSKSVDIDSSGHRRGMRFSVNERKRISKKRQTRKLDTASFIFGISMPHHKSITERYDSLLLAKYCAGIFMTKHIPRNLRAEKPSESVSYPRSDSRILATKLRLKRELKTVNSNSTDKVSSLTENQIFQEGRFSLQEDYTFREDEDSLQEDLTMREDKPNLHEADPFLLVDEVAKDLRELLTVVARELEGCSIIAAYDDEAAEVMEQFTEQVSF